MADIEQVRAAVAALVAGFDDIDQATRTKIPDSTVSATIRDLDTAFAGRFDAGELVDVREIAPAHGRDATLRLTLTSDVLLDLLEGRLSFGHGWTTGRIKVDARLRDVMKLRSFL